jgi:queuine/archaeosine tRNA-ribosyltransferase
MRHPQFLVSAADIFRLRKERQESSRKISELITQASQNGQIVLLDSGNYERFWQRLRKWTPKELQEVLSYVPVQLAFCYDNLTPSSDPSQIVKEIEKSAARDRRENQMEAMLPIVHCSEPKLFPTVCGQVVTKLQPLMIAIPERELGFGLLERLSTVIAIRREMNRTGRYCPIHILGTGNPRSLLLFVAAGADSFDGLEWCQTAVDCESYSLHHLSHVDLFWHQSPFGALSGTAPAARALAHNLWFYESWMKRIRAALATDSLRGLGISVFGAEMIIRIESAVPALFGYKN